MLRAYCLFAVKHQQLTTSTITHIPQVYFQGVFVNCILQVYFQGVFVNCILVYSTNKLTPFTYAKPSHNAFASMGVFRLLEEIWLEQQVFEVVLPHFQRTQSFAFESVVVFFSFILFLIETVDVSASTHMLWHYTHRRRVPAQGASERILVFYALDITCIGKETSKRNNNAFKKHET